MSYHRAKIVLAGQSGVGKSSIVSRFYNRDISNPEATIGAALNRKTVREKDTSITMDIWDTAGQERFRSMAGFYFRGCHYCILVFSLDDHESFDNLRIWKDACEIALERKSPRYFLVGNKLDKKRMVSSEEIKQYCDKNKVVQYIETSAKNGDGVQELFDAVIAHLFKNASSLPTIDPQPEPVEQCQC